MPMSSIADLQTIYGGWNPEAYNQGRTQVGLEQQYQQELNRNQQMAGNKAQLSNMYDSRTLDDRVRQPGLANQRTEQDILSNDYGLRSKKRTDQREEAMQQYNLDADQRKALMGITEDELKQGELYGYQMLRSLDPNQQRDGERILSTLPAVRAARQKAMDDMEQERYKQMQETGRGVERNQTTLEAARIGAQSREQVQGMKGSSSGSAKPPKNAEEARLRQIFQSNLPDDQKEALVLEIMNANLAARTAAATAGIAPAVGANGDIELQNKPSAPQVTGRTSSGPVAPPVSAANHLKANPQLADAFDAKYGKGAAAKILGK